FLNKAELIKLTNIDNIEQGVKKILKINNKIKIVATNSKNNVIYADDKSIIKLKPPKIKVKNENGAGDALAGMMLYLLSKGYNKEQMLKYSVACGSYYANGNKLRSKKDLLKIKNVSRSVKLK
ncbi:PfkB family carbohydrate kinase, partial [Pelagibacteraceae bacterium]|nr:PfkB family carbohydrate kinase [Pelagibacteraceae bacterium]